MARLIQFIHPGGERIPDARSLQGKQPPYHFPWNTGDHKRKFLQGKGTYLTGKPGNWQVQKDKVFSFWSEAEWDTEYTPIAKNPQILANGLPLPQFLHSFVDKSLEMPVNRAQLEVNSHGVSFLSRAFCVYSICTTTLETRGGVYVKSMGLLQNL